MKHRFLKVARDRCVKGWKFPEGDFGMEYGSGYPNGKVHNFWLCSLFFSTYPSQAETISQCVTNI